ncbi:succinate dehydrogenase, cytochrome b556 subunit [Methylobacterium sp. NEAU 140]|uniref:succinate dehydrogenase, cytochrome b556 subunit n=1 Tax=Methylobacterium sp. NEAU 140 TaxID=3064945 RepID=UPI002734A8A7|nr:succinate dehydrogenase, cytochrome b556 subunit [Methylobacterium sp. NEAU 140]MDP4022199.1 succinate dehydrogenase, cytochrome b556 subunit [Methylobacterium sp. NEAU 140]
MAPTARPTVAQPLSPHLQIYRWTWTMAMSVVHRITGTALYGGTALVAIWLVALAAGPAAYGWVAGFFGSWLGRLVLFAYTWVLLHHMLGGIRHFVWDAGAGFDRAQRLSLARLTLIGSVSLTVVVWAVALLVR